MSTFVLSDFVSAKDTAERVKTARGAGLISSAWGTLTNLVVAANVASIGLETTTTGAVVKTLASIEASLDEDLTASLGKAEPAKPEVEIS